MSKEFSKKVKEHIEEVVSRYIHIDMDFLLEASVGEVIRSFRPVSAETIQKTISDFVNGSSDGEDFCLCLKVGTDVNGLVGGQMALIKAVLANTSREAAEMILRDGADLEVRAGNVSSSIKGGEGRVVARDMALMVACHQLQLGLVDSEFLVAVGAPELDCGLKGYRVGKQALQIACVTTERDLDTPEDQDPED
uniref:Uncharacterized protein n=1 Tax=Chromera velia CCMP2878 TaxID=1169474 RepID=A0A0G4GIY7_9ALVE|eukprot:Cvel_22098.t1-p1 / transcript=Cvel_22098.t1 / gene=Cvel_22098 / organism=Chromera_velia_CCMP2878 / gene_product=hypothetical protein / transcript_product=hypothetical protein / location=Cvel_scaffold2139:14687-15265(+) / protein_length=193 / sequence_SO=supercontig / SO=protein_coding / is_pseudo=false